MSTPPIPPNIEELTAPMMLGALWNWTLYGVLVVQLYVYSYNFPGDRTFLKLLVYSVFLVETLQTALTGADLYHWFVSGFGNMEHLAPYLSNLDVPIIGSIIALTVQLFFVYRIWVLSGRSSRSLFLCSMICLCSTVGVVPALYGGIYAHIHNQWGLNQHLVMTLGVTWLSGNAASDVLITGSMLFYLSRRRKGDGCWSDHALSRIIRLTIETNVLTTTVGIVSLLMIAIFDDKNWVTCPVAILGKLYSNTLLVSLNNRISIREGRGAVVRSPTVTVSLSSGSRPIPGIVDVQLKRPPTASVTGSSEGSTGQATSKVFDIV